MANRTLENKRDFLLNNNNLYTNALYLAWPIVLQSLLQVSIGTIDIRMVGSLGVNAIAAVGAGRNVVMVIMVIVIAISTGTTAMVSRYVGRNDEENASITAGQSFYLAVAASAFMIPLGLLTNEWILGLLGVGDEVLSLATDYMLIFFISVPFFLLNFIGRAIFQGAGDTKTPLVIDIIMNISNVALNYGFIFGFWVFPEMGVMGAAIGTALSRVIGTTLGWSALLSGRFIIKVRLSHMLKPKWKRSKRIIDIGFPAALQGITRNVTTFILFAILARTIHGEAAIPAFVIGTNLSQYALMPGLAVGTAAATLSGMNIGANKMKRAEESGKSCVIVGAGFMMFFALIFVIFADPLIRFFLDGNNPEVLRIGKNFLYIIALSEPFHAATIILSRTMQGAGYTKKPFYVTLISWLFIRVSLALLFAFAFNLQSTGVWLAINLSTVISAGMAYYLFRLGKWKHVELHPKEALQRG